MAGKCIRLEVTHEYWNHPRGVGGGGFWRVCLYRDQARLDQVRQYAARACLLRARHTLRHAGVVAISPAGSRCGRRSVSVPPSKGCHSSSRCCPRSRRHRLRGSLFIHVRTLAKGRIGNAPFPLLRVLKTAIVSPCTAAPLDHMPGMAQTEKEGTTMRRRCFVLLIAVALVLLTASNAY